MTKSDRTEKPDFEQGEQIASRPTPADRPKRRDDRLNEDLNRERLEPGLNAEGTGGAGAEPGQTKTGNSKPQKLERT